MHPALTRTGLLGVAVACLAVAVPQSAAALGPCRPATDMSGWMIRDITRYVTATSGDDARARTALRLTATSADSVTLVQVDSVCVVAAAAYKTALFRFGYGRGFSGSVWVVKAGDRYVVLDPEVYYKARDIHFRVVFDARWQKLSEF